MKTFKASALTHNRAEVMKAAREDGAIIQECRTNGEVIQEFVFISKDAINSMECDCNEDRFVGLSELINGKPKAAICEPVKWWGGKADELNGGK